MALCGQTGYTGCKNKWSLSVTKDKEERSGETLTSKKKKTQTTWVQTPKQFLPHKKNKK